MRNFYFINVFFCGFLFLASIGIMVATFTIAEPSKELLGCMSIMFTMGMSGSYLYYTNAKDWKEKMNSNKY